MYVFGCHFELFVTAAWQSHTLKMLVFSSNIIDYEDRKEQFSALCSAAGLLSFPKLSKRTIERLRASQHSIENLRALKTLLNSFSLL